MNNIYTSTYRCVTFLNISIVSIIIVYSETDELHDYCPDLMKHNKFIIRITHSMRNHYSHNVVKQ